MLPDEPPLDGALLLGDLPVDGPLQQATQVTSQRRVMDKMEKLVEPTAMSALLCSESTSATANTTELVDSASVFKAGSISVRKDMVARLPAMHISDFKRNLRDLERPCLKVNELKLTTNKSQDIKLCESSLRVLNTPNVRLFSSIFSTFWFPHNLASFSISLLLSYLFADS